jgi:hypothetical protein
MRTTLLARCFSSRRCKNTNALGSYIPPPQPSMELLQLFRSQRQRDWRRIARTETPRSCRRPLSMTFAVVSCSSAFSVLCLCNHRCSRLEMVCNLFEILQVSDFIFIFLHPQSLIIRVVLRVRILPVRLESIPRDGQRIFFLSSRTWELVVSTRRRCKSSATTTPLRAFLLIGAELNR